MKEKKNEVRGYKIIGSSMILSVGVLGLMLGVLPSDESHTAFPFIVFIFGIYLFVDAWTGRSVMDWYNLKFKDDVRSTKRVDDDRE